MHRDTSDLSSPNVSSPSPVRWVVIAHIVLLLVVLRLVWIFPSSAVFIAIVVAVSLAQAALISMWLVLGRGPSAKRIVAVSLLLLLLLVVPQMVCPIAVFSLPLILTQSDGLHLKRYSSGDMPPARPLQFSMGWLARVTIVMAVLFALGQFGPPTRREALTSNLGELGNVLAVIGVVVVGLTCAAVAVTIPVVCIWAVLSPGRMLPRLCVAVLGWSLGGTLLFHFAGGVRSELVVAVEIAGLSAVVLMVTLLALRGMGYRIFWQVEPPWFESSRARRIR